MVIGNKSSFLVTICVFVASVFFTSCRKKENESPQLLFKIASGYTSADVMVAPGTTVLVGVIADKGSDPLKLVYTEVAYDGANVDSLYTRIEVPEGSAHYEHDFTIQTRNQVGTERWTFNVNDKDGRLTEKEIRIIVQ